MIFNNPLIRRYRYSLMRPRQLWVHLIIHISIIALLLYVNYTAYEYQGAYGNTTRLFAGVCSQIMILQALVLCIWGAFNSGSVITNEITENSYDFFRMLPLSAGKKAAGILIGKNLIVLLIAFIDLILIIILGKLGQVNFSWLGQTFLTLLSLALLINTVALLSSIKLTRRKKKSNIATIILIFFFLGPFLIRTFILIPGFSYLKTVTATFYAIKLPLMILISLVAIYFSCWSIIGILRKFNKEDEPLFSRAGAYLFMIGYEFVLCGILFKSLTGIASPNIVANTSPGILTLNTVTKEAPGIINYSYWLISLLPILAVPLWSIRSYDNYLEGIGLIQKKSAPGKSIMPRMLLYSNLSLGFGLFAIWAACAIGTTIMIHLPLSSNFYMILVLFSSYLLLILLLELYVVYNPKSPKMGILIAFITAVYIILPLILNEMLENEILFQLSPIGLIFEMFPKSQNQITIHISILLINLLLCVIPILLILKQYFHILSTRQKMKTNI